MIERNDLEKTHINEKAAGTSTRHSRGLMKTIHKRAQSTEVTLVTFSMGTSCPLKVTLHWRVTVTGIGFIPTIPILVSIWNFSPLPSTKSILDPCHRPFLTSIIVF